MNNVQACIVEELVVQAKREKSYAVKCKRLGWIDQASAASTKRAQLIQEARRVKERAA